LRETFFSIIQVVLDNECFKLRFGIWETDYYRIKNIVTFRPFENTGVVPYRYFYANSYLKTSSAEHSTISVRVEQLKQHKQFDFQIGIRYISHLLWFQEIKDNTLFEPYIIS